MTELFHRSKNPKRDSDSYSFVFRNFPFKKAKSVKKV